MGAGGAPCFWDEEAVRNRPESPALASRPGQRVPSKPRKELKGGADLPGSPRAQARGRPFRVSAGHAAGLTRGRLRQASRQGRKALAPSFLGQSREGKAKPKPGKRSLEQFSRGVLKTRGSQNALESPRASGQHREGAGSHAQLHTWALGSPTPASVSSLGSLLPGASGPWASEETRCGCTPTRLRGTGAWQAGHHLAGLARSALATAVEGDVIFTPEPKIEAAELSPPRALVPRACWQPLLGPLQLRCPAFSPVTSPTRPTCTHASNGVPAAAPHGSVGVLGVFGWSGLGRPTRRRRVVTEQREGHCRGGSADTVWSLPLPGGGMAARPAP